MHQLCYLMKLPAGHDLQGLDGCPVAAKILELLQCIQQAGHIDTLLLRQSLPHESGGEGQPDPISRKFLFIDLNDSLICGQGGRIE